jgi:hypothetical protein
MQHLPGGQCLHSGCPTPPSWQDLVRREGTRTQSNRSASNPKDAVHQNPKISPLHSTAVLSNTAPAPEPSPHAVH